MRIDLYTKTVLTIIALCLLWQCMFQAPALQAQPSQPKTSQAKAPESAAPVVITGFGAYAGPLHVIIDGVDPQHSDGVLPVTIAGYHLDRPRPVTSLPQ